MTSPENPASARRPGHEPDPAATPMAESGNGRPDPVSGRTIAMRPAAARAAKYRARRREGQSVFRIELDGEAARRAAAALGADPDRKPEVESALARAFQAYIQRFAL